MQTTIAAGVAGPLSLHRAFIEVKYVSGAADHVRIGSDRRERKGEDDEREEESLFHAIPPFLKFVWKLRKYRPQGYACQLLYGIRLKCYLLRTALSRDLQLI